MIQLHLSLGITRVTTEVQIFDNIVKLHSYIIETIEGSVIKVHVRILHV